MRNRSAFETIKAYYLENEKQTMTYAQLPDCVRQESWANWYSKCEGDQCLPDLADSDFTRKRKLDILAKGISMDQFEELTYLKHDAQSKLTTSEADRADIECLIRDIDHVISAQSFGVACQQPPMESNAACL